MNPQSKSHPNPSQTRPLAVGRRVAINLCGTNAGHLSLPARNERGESRREGDSRKLSTSSPRPSPPSSGGRRGRGHRRLVHSFKAGTFVRGILALLVLYAGWTRAETGVDAWVQRYSHFTDSADAARKVVTDNAGNVIVAGSSANGIAGGDIVVIKYSGGGRATLDQPLQRAGKRH